MILNNLFDGRSITDHGFSSRGYLVWWFMTSHSGQRCKFDQYYQRKKRGCTTFPFRMSISPSFANASYYQRLCQFWQERGGGKPRWLIEIWSVSYQGKTTSWTTFPRSWELSMSLQPYANPYYQYFCQWIRGFKPRKPRRASGWITNRNTSYARSMVRILENVIKSFRSNRHFRCRWRFGTLKLKFYCSNWNPSPPPPQKKSSCKDISLYAWYALLFASPEGTWVQLMFNLLNDSIFFGLQNVKIHRWKQ